MKLASISDIHIVSPGDHGWETLMAFLDHPETQSSDHIVLLGDIFDLMCGDHEEYLEMFAPFFAKIREILMKKKLIWYFEGNHDLHLQKIFDRALGEHSLYRTHFKLFMGPQTLKLGDDEVYLTHGDELDLNNVSYHRYRAFINTAPLKFIANHILPYALFDYLGKRASKKSRKRGSHFFNEEEVREKYRLGAWEVSQGKYKYVLAGHCHVRDIFQLSDHSLYLNNGYATRSHEFIVITPSEGKLVPLF